MATSSDPTKDNAQLSTIEVALFPSFDLFNIPELGDFKVKCKDTVFYVSKLSLASSSIVLRTMLTTPSYKECQEGEMEINETDVESVEAFLRYCFNRTPVQTFALARNVIELANKYQMEDLKGTCEKVLIEGITAQTLQDLLNLIYDFHLNNLLQACFAVGHKTTDRAGSVTEKKYDPIMLSTFLKVKLPIERCATLYVAHRNDYISIEPAVLYFEKPCRDHKITLSLEPGNSMKGKSENITIDMYSVYGNGLLKPYRLINIPVNFPLSEA